MGLAGANLLGKARSQPERSCGPPSLSQNFWLLSLLGASLAFFAPCSPSLSSGHVFEASVIVNSADKIAWARQAPTCWARCEAARRTRVRKAEVAHVDRVAQVDYTVRGAAGRGAEPHASAEKEADISTENASESASSITDRLAGFMNSAKFVWPHLCVDVVGRTAARQLKSLSKLQTARHRFSRHTPRGSKWMCFKTFKFPKCLFKKFRFGVATIFSSRFLQSTTTSQ